jgi:glycosyltransferase involved in cell wall biosynthesis
MANYYSVFSNCFNFSLNWGEGIEKRAMNRASNIIVSSKWAAQSVIDDYHLSPDKVSIVHFGANLLHEPIEPKAVRDHDREFRLLWVGVDWERKGGKIAYELMIKLNELGINTTLFVCGCDPQITKPHRGLRSLGFLDKGITSQNAQLDEIYRQADVFILPTKSECAGIVFAEAAAYSLPIITYNTGGVSDYVHDNVNGYLLDPITATTADWLEKLTHLYKDKESYQNMSTHSFALFKHLLNWQHWLKQVEPIILQTSVKVRH